MPRAIRERDPLVLPKIAPAPPKCTWYTPARAARVARKRTRQISQLMAVQAVEQEFFIGKGEG